MIEIRIVIRVSCLEGRWTVNRELQTLQKSNKDIEEL